ncbi:MAG TPA: molybdenum cofactor guanylyltransferase [Gemmatimonadales bacterium]|nr:molybdenum cofactor guanylyltransferase [Gemmatimonadales bacterium]
MTDRTARGAIIAGGGATRFGGRPKGLERVGGERILDRVAAALAEALGVAPLLVANAPEAPSWRPDLRVVPDLLPGLGALGGIYTAVVEAPAPVVAVAWDLPFVTAGLIRALADRLAGVDAVLPTSPDGRGLEPLCAAYGPGCRPAIAAALEAGDLRAVGFHPRITLGILPLSDLRVMGDPDLLFLNVNTADDLARADHLWRRHASSRSSAGRTPERPR